MGLVGRHSLLRQFNRLFFMGVPPMKAWQPTGGEEVMEESKDAIPAFGKGWWLHADGALLGEVGSG